MTQAQLKYIRQRAEGIYEERRRSIEKLCRDEGVTLDIFQRLDAIRNGEFTVKQPTTNQGPHQWSYQITFDAERPPVMDNERYTKLIGALQADFQKLMDELMLGDNEEALKLLKEFELVG